MKHLTWNLKLSKILMNYKLRKEDEDYLNYISMDTKVTWDEFSIFIPLLDENQKQIEDNQRIYKAKIKKLLPEYKENYKTKRKRLEE